MRLLGFSACMAFAATYTAKRQDVWLKKLEQSALNPRQDQ
jgi:hypothetical protein